MEFISLMRTFFVLVSLLFLGYLILKPNQSSKINWAMFFAGLWVMLTLLVVNLLCVNLGLWEFYDRDLVAQIPLDIYFSWVIFWSCMPVFFLRGKYILVTSLVVFWLDILIMPKMETYGVLSLADNWLIGELALVVLVFLPAQYWAYLFINNKLAGVRSFFQTICVAILYFAIFPLLVFIYFPDFISTSPSLSPYLVQLVFIVALPALVAVIDLVQKGHGTPFPYDPTHRIVQSGVYAYCRNPIQVSLTLLFIPLAYQYESWFLLSGVVISLAYTLAVANPQENKSMNERFSSDWARYKKQVPNWYFLWRPLNIPQGSIYFKGSCGICQKTRIWFRSKTPINLAFMEASQWQGEQLRALTYVDEFDNQYTSVLAMAHAFGHINLFWASIGWFMRLPGIHQVLQVIVDAVGLRDFQ